MATTDTFSNDRRHLSDRRADTSAGSLRASSRMNAIDWIAMVLMIVGGINWGLIGLFNYNLVSALFGEMSALSRVIYALVGISALYSIYTSSKLADQRD